MVISQIIDVTTDQKYLGVFLSDERKDECDIKRQIKGICTREIF